MQDMMPPRTGSPLGSSILLRARATLRAWDCSRTVEPVQAIKLSRMPTCTVFTLPWQTPTTSANFKVWYLDARLAYCYSRSRWLAGTDMMPPSLHCGCLRRMLASSLLSSCIDPLCVQQGLHSSSSTSRNSRRQDGGIRPARLQTPK